MRRVVPVHKKTIGAPPPLCERHSTHGNTWEDLTDLVVKTMISIFL